MDNKVKIASYNILANSYIKPEWYTQSNPEILKWEKRKVLLAKKIEELKTDIICLQEVEQEAFNFLEASLKRKQYHGIYSQKDYGKPDGCATFFKEDSLSLKSKQTVYYNDKEKGITNSGHLALILEFKFDIGAIKVVNTHLRWDNKVKEQHIGYKQIKELIINNIKLDNSSYGWIICGDFNAQPSSFVIKELLNNNFKDAYKNKEQNTCNPNRKAKRIDYIFYSEKIKLEPSKLEEIDDLTPLPSEVEPSDHLAIMAMLVL